jgi:dipeptidase D
VQGSILINLDSEEDGRLTVGCAGSTDTWIRIEVPREAAEGDQVTLAVTVSGGSGGHSGTGIALGRSNAVKLLGRTLREARETVPFRLGLVRGREEPQCDPP